jgi:hypothetical protein
VTTHAVEAVPAKKSLTGRKRKAADQRLPDRGDLLIPDSPLFSSLQDAERRIDLLISRKKHELQEMYASFRRGGPGDVQQWCCEQSLRACCRWCAVRLLLCIWSQVLVTS